MKYWHLDQGSQFYGGSRLNKQRIPFFGLVMKPGFYIEKIISMKRLLILFKFWLLCLVLIGCNNTSSERGVKKDYPKKEKETSKSISSELGSLPAESKSYLQHRDFDGDKIMDHLSFNYTGGAHCCYKMILKLSSMKDTVKYPFEMDGGYEFGRVDGSRHDQFEIYDFDKDGLPEIFMGISIYNGEKNPIDPEWFRKYGIQGNFIIFNYNDGEIVIENYDEKRHKSKLKRR